MNKKLKIEVIYGDLITFCCDALVNSANSSLLAGSGLCGAMHKVAGKELESECVALGKCEVGKCKITKAYNLSQNGVGWIIHAVSPRWLGGINHEEELLKLTYKSCLDMVIEYQNIYRKQMRPILDKYFSKEQLEVELLELDRYINSHPIKHIAFPAIGVGIYHFPLELSAKLVKEVFERETVRCGDLEKISIVCADENVYKIYHSIFTSDRDKRSGAN